VLSVALGTFTLVTNEFLPVGLLVDGEPPNQTPEVERAKANAIAEAAR
jgi:hypothetical protein